MVLRNVVLVFGRPKQLFAEIRDGKNASGQFLVPVVIVICYFVAAFFRLRIEGVGEKGELWGLLISNVALLAVLYLGIIWDTGYAFIFLKFFGKSPDTKKIFAGLIFCRLPLIVAALFSMLLPANLSLYSLFQDFDTIHSGVSMFFQRVEIFEIWIIILEIVAIGVITNLSFRKTAVIAISSWLISIIGTYILDTFKFAS